MPRQPDRLRILAQRRETLLQVWRAFAHEAVLPQSAGVVSAEVASSWRRTVRHLNPWSGSAPLESLPSVGGLWQASPLREALAPLQDELQQLVEEGSLAVVLADNLGRVLWSFSSQYMQQRAAEVNFAPGGLWDERSAGTNGISMALRQRRPLVLFGAEHYLGCLHDWVSYAAPIQTPQSTETLGVLCFATTWEKHTPLGELAVTELAHNLRRNLPANLVQVELQVRAMGMPRILFRGQEIRLSPRQLEILCLLVLNPQGLSLAQLHSALYGDTNVTSASLKAELSHLRHILGGAIGSRPYQLQLSTWADFIIIWQLLKEKRAEDALNLYRGAFLPNSASPELEEWRNCIEAVMEQALDACRDPGVLLSSLCHGSQASERVRERLLEMAENEPL